MSEVSYEGGCHCGAVRFRAHAPIKRAAFCHCSDCRKVAGAPVVAWVILSAAQFEITQGEPKRYASSKNAVRQFCGDCGTPLTYRQHGSATLDVPISILDNPESIRPDAHIFTRDRLDWMNIADDLPQFPGWRDEGS